MTSENGDLEQALLPVQKKGRQHAFQRESRTRASGPLVNFALFGDLGAGYRRTLTPRRRPSLPQPEQLVEMFPRRAPARLRET